MRALLILFIALFIIHVYANPIAGYEIVIENGSSLMMSNYFEYNISTLTGNAVCQQPSNAGGGTYFVFHSQEAPTSTLRTYYAYMDAAGILTNGATISNDDLSAACPALAIDPITGDPIVAWNTGDGIMLTYDLFHLGSPGLWKTPFNIFNGNITFHHPDDFFQFPAVEIGESPNPGQRRVYILAMNQRVSNPGEDYCNTMLAYADFDENDFNTLSELDWTYNMVMITMNDNTTTRFTFTSGYNGKLAIIGYNFDQQVFAYINENYGEGDFEFHTADFKFPVGNPLNLDGTPCFQDDEGNPYELFFAPMFSSNSNAIFAENDERILYPICFNLCAEPDIVQVEDCLLYPKVITFDLNSEEFSFYDLHLEGDDPSDDLPAVPWDVDENGLVDSYDLNGNVDWIPSWPIYYFDNMLPYPFTMNNMKITQNEENDLITIFWNDSSKAYFAANTSSSTWEAVPEIISTYSQDGGTFWSEEQYLNSNVTPALEDMIPEFFYPADKIVEIGYGEYIMKAMFYNDFAYAPPGWFPQEQGGQIVAVNMHYYPGEQDNHIHINHPTTNEVFTAGEEMEISWNCWGSAMVAKIDLMIGSDEFVQCITEEPGDGVFNWEIPEGLSTGSNYKLRLMGLSPQNYYLSQTFTISNVHTSDEMIVTKNELYQNSPNPFNPSTTISFQLKSHTEEAELSIYNSKGQKVKSFDFAQDDIQRLNSVIWNGTDDSGKPVSSGVYLYKLKVGNIERSRKMLLLK